MAQEDCPRLKAVEFLMFGAADVVKTLLDRDCTDFSHLENQLIEVDGIEFRCKFVLERPQSPPYRKGDRISLIITVEDDDA
ncbi:MAG: hypothetical protein WAW96_04760 [Alphaproteobacteria bacterium]